MPYSAASGFGLSAPHIFSMLSKARASRPEDMNDDIARIDQDPIAKRHSFNLCIANALLLQLVEKAVGDSAGMALRAPRADDHEIGKRGFVRQGDADDLVGLGVIERFDDQGSERGEAAAALFARRGASPSELWFSALSLSVKTLLLDSVPEMLRFPHVDKQNVHQFRYIFKTRRWEFAAYRRPPNGATSMTCIPIDVMGTSTARNICAGWKNSPSGISPPRPGPWRRRSPGAFFRNPASGCSAAPARTELRAGRAAAWPEPQASRPRLLCLGRSANRFEASWRRARACEKMRWLRGAATAGPDTPRSWRFDFTHR